MLCLLLPFDTSGNCPFYSTCYLNTLQAVHLDSTAPVRQARFTDGENEMKELVQLNSRARNKIRTTWLPVLSIRKSSLPVSERTYGNNCIKKVQSEHKHPNRQAGGEKPGQRKQEVCLPSPVKENHQQIKLTTNYTNQKSTIRRGPNTAFFVTPFEEVILSLGKQKN